MFININSKFYEQFDGCSHPKQKPECVLTGSIYGPCELQKKYLKLKLKARKLERKISVLKEAVPKNCIHKYILTTREKDI